MLTELTREVIRIAEADGTKLEPFDPFDPNAFTRDADQSAADRAFQTIFNHRLGSAKKHSGMWRDIAVRKRKPELDTLLLTRARRRRAARCRDAAQHALGADGPRDRSRQAPADLAKLRRVPITDD